MRVAWISTGFALLLTLVAAEVARAEKAADLQPAHFKAGNVLLDDALSRAELGSKWAVNKGAWKIEEGVIIGQEVADDKHAAVLTLAQPHRNAIARFSFRIDDAKGFHLSFNHAKGHLFRIVVTESGLAVTKDKDKKDPESKALPLGKAEGKFETGKWYTMLVETRGDQVFVETDNGLKLHGRNSGLDVDKTGYRFVKPGASLRLDDIKIWSIEP